MTRTRCFNAVPALFALAMTAAAIVLPSLASPPPSAPPAPQQPAHEDHVRRAALEQRLRDILERFRERAGFPGGGIGFVLPDGSAGSVATGLADVENAIPMRVDHRLPAGSTGKSLFAAVAMQLVSEGMIALDDPLSKWLGHHAWFERLPNARQVTLRMLMNHTSGVPEHVQMPAFTTALRDQPDRSWKPDELIAFILDAPPHNEAGKDWAYADTNYILLGMSLERASGVSAYELVRTRLLTPHVLNEIHPQDRRDLPNLACGYMQPGRALIEIEQPRTVIDGRFFINPQFEWCGGGFIATPRDLARWTHLMWSGDAILPENAREQMTDGVAARTGRNHRYGLGVQIRPTSHGLTFGHGGFFPGSMTETAHFAEHGFTLAIMVNSDHHTSPRSLMQCLDECADAILAVARQH